MQNQSMNITLENVIDIILRRRWYIIIPFCLSMLSGIFYSVQAPKIYEASTLILVKHAQVPQNYIPSVDTSDPGDKVNTISEQLYSRSNLERVIHEFKLFTGAEYEKMFMEDKVNILRARISVNITRAKSRRGSESFSISLRGKDPEETMKITNFLATHFINVNLMTRESHAMATSEFLNSELNTMREKLEEVEGKLKEHRKKYMGQLPEQLQANLTILQRLQEQLSDRRTSLRQEKNRLAVIEQLISSPLIPAQVAGQAPPAVGESSDPNVLKEQLNVLSTKYTERHPDVIKLKKIIEDLEIKKDRESETASQVPEIRPQPSLRDENYRQREEIKLGIGRLEKEILEVHGQIAYYQNRIEVTPKREQELASLKRDYENIQSAYNSLLERKMEADIAVNMEKRKKDEEFQVFKIIDTASLPRRPVEPDMRKLFLIFLAVGFGIGGGIVFLLEYLDTSFRSPEDIEPLGVSMLATIPVLTSRKDRVLQRSHQILSIFSILISFSLFTGLFLLTFKGEDALLSVIGKFIQI